MSLLEFKAGNHPQQTKIRGADDAIDDRATHPLYWDGFNDEYGPFTLDVAAAAHNTKCERYYDKHVNGLLQPWDGIVWCNPPFSDLEPWIRKAWAEWERGECERIVVLLPANRAEQKFWQRHVEPHRDKPGSPLRLRFLPGRMRFVMAGDLDLKSNSRPPFGCCLLIWDRTL